MEVDGTLLTILGVSAGIFDSNWMGAANLTRATKQKASETSQIS